MIDHWPSGGRDTTEFPQIKIDIDATLRSHLAAFCKLDGVAWNDYDKQKEVSGLNVGDSRLRTYRKLYENLGVVYKKNDVIRISQLGNKLNSISLDLEKSKDSSLTKLAYIAVDILARYQIDNPTESQRNDLPDQCNVLPCVCFWQAMLQLDGKLHYEEVNRVILRVMTMDALDGAIDKIRKARTDIFPYSGKDSHVLDESLGVPVHTEQESARIAPWFSFAGWGGLLIEREVDSDGFRNLVNKNVGILREAVSKPYNYFKTQNEDEWYDYYIGSAVIKGPDFNQSNSGSELNNISSKFEDDASKSDLKLSIELIKRFIASLLSKRLVIVTGLAGSGKTKIAQAFARWLTPSTESIYPFKRGSSIESDRITYYVIDSDRLSVTFSNNSDSSAETLVTLPISIIEEWANYINSHSLTRDVGARQIREGVSSNSKFSSQLHSFETHLKAAAFTLLDANKSHVEASYYQLVPVGADWTGNENIIGYPNGLDNNTYVAKPALELVRHALEPSHKAIPHFLILDEMNLSHVERYFADILSAIESGEEIPLYEGDERAVDGGAVPRKLRLPENLFIIGTVNVDETTYMFSPKVLDRANVIEFRLEPDGLQSFLSSPKAPKLEELDGKGVDFSCGFVEAAADKGREVPAAVKESYEREMLLFFNLLREHNAEFGYRTSYEAARFIHFYNQLGGYSEGSVDWFDSAMDAVVVQKFLPKLHGSRSKLEGLLWALAWACGAERIDRGGKSFAVQIREASQAQDDALYGPEELWKILAAINPDDPAAAARYPLSFDKVMRMWRKLVRDQFVTFAEA